jgi:hypothetical protein
LDTDELSCSKASLGTRGGGKMIGTGGEKAAGFRQTAFWVGALIFLAIGIWAIVQVRQATSPKFAREKALCDSLQKCQDYAKVSGLCAAAADVKGCIRAKLWFNVGDFSDCAKDGALSSAPDDMPSAAACFGHKFGL